MASDRRFPVEKLARLDGDARRARQPPGPVVELVAETSPQRVVDLGIGTGYFAIPIAVRLPECIVIGIDIETAMLAPLEEKAIAAGVVDRIRALMVSEAEGASLPLMDATADLVLMAQIFHELGDRSGSLAETWRALVPGGRLVICDWSVEGTTEAGPPRDHRIPLATAAAEVQTAGFTAVESRDLYPDFFTLVAQRPR